MDRSELISNFWQKKEKTNSSPTRCSNIKLLDYEEFEKKIYQDTFLEEFIENIFKGNVYILKRAYSKEFIKKVKTNVMKFISSRPSEFYQIKQNCPDFHRIVDEAVTDNYSIRAINHQIFFFPWNNDPCNILDEIYKKIRLLKLLGGKKETEYENNKPLDGIIDRIKIAIYPQGGSLQLHSDPKHIRQRLFMGAYLSKRGEDYKSGGFYLKDNSNQDIDVEKFIDAGDIGIGLPTLLHGVKKINGDCNPNWNLNGSRWWIGFGSINSDEMASDKRITSKPVYNYK